jgi:hypothetical protein
MRVSDEEVLKMYESGLGAQSIAEKIGYSAQGVLAKVRRAGGTVRPTGRNLKARGWHIDANGYVYEIVTEDWTYAEEMARPFGTLRNDGRRSCLRVPQHRKVMADHLGRALLPTETVHHIDGDKTNNAIENLQLRQGRHGNGVRLVCSSCGSDDLVPEELAEAR